jgi:hypothetical protein
MPSDVNIMTSTEDITAIAPGLTTEALLALSLELKLAIGACASTFADTSRDWVQRKRASSAMWHYKAKRTPVLVELEKRRLRTRAATATE